MHKYRFLVNSKMTGNKPTLVFATNNSHKLDEIRKIVGGRINVLSLKEIGCEVDIPENEPTLEGNALAKARWLAEHYGCDCFADDTGLEVEALDGAPGVHSARYAPGTDHDSQANMRHLLDKMQNHSKRDARFRTVIALMLGGEVRLFEGEVKGEITRMPAGNNGFGYDPIFRPEGYEQTFAELSDIEKNSISHRGRATAKLVKYLTEEYINEK